MDKYKQYQTEDFLQDENFIKWVLDPDAPGGQSWQAWMKANPDKREAAQRAVDIIRSFDFNKETIAENFYVNLKQRIDNTIEAEHRTPVRKMKIPGVWLKAACIVAGIIVIGIGYFNRRPSYTYFSTPYAAIKTVYLPDSTEVVLNANSSVRYSKSRGAREVLLSGEAFFKVRHVVMDGKTIPFNIHAGNSVIEVLGTEFNVKDLNNETAVFLKKGKVKFSIPASHTATLMQPNDYCYYNAAQQKIITRVANPDLFTAWMEHKYRFENATVKEVCETLKAYFGYDFIIRNDKLDTQTVSGTLELNNEQVMLTVLGELFKTKITKEGNKIIVE
ncbi:FecR family protein [Niastella sp. OAS944]|uniref:FecR family protein n=1 Tax=Niastella sp. OAS944 TaxID=2664089 RepID=UPI00347D96DD|nr:ferric-dicitrate binding protein FerR (iron transport regulator) [Chitinophagaceae bacterium OAS944]